MSPENKTKTNLSLSVSLSFPASVKLALSNRQLVCVGLNSQCGVFVLDEHAGCESCRKRTAPEKPTDLSKYLKNDYNLNQNTRNTMTEVPFLGLHTNKRKTSMIVYTESPHHGNLGKHEGII